MSGVAPAPFAAAAALVLAAGCLVAAAQPAPQAVAPLDGASALRARFDDLRRKGQGALFDRPLYLESTSTPDRAQGDVHALVEHPYPALRETLLQPHHWCGILMLHLNVQYCRAGSNPQAPVLDIGIGRKFDQPLAELHWMKLGWRAATVGVDHLHVTLEGEVGPFGTRDFRIELQAAPYGTDRALVHLAYGYRYGTLARWAMHTYLNTLGRAKVGFSVIGVDAAGRPRHVDGLRGLLERNTVRYEFAIEAYLKGRGQPAPQQWRASLQAWFDATERYPLQLHEIDREAYLAMKLAEARRTASTPPPQP